MSANPSHEKPPIGRTPDIYVRHIIQSVWRTLRERINPAAPLPRLSAKQTHQLCDELEQRYIPALRKLADASVPQKPDPSQVSIEARIVMPGETDAFFARLAKRAEDEL